MELPDSSLTRALEYAIQGNLEEALNALAALNEPAALQLAAYLRLQQKRERERASAMTKARHDLGNALSIAQASVEAMLDGVVGVTDPRLNRLREILAGVSDSLYELTAEPPKM
jgi:hypothetical protein